MTGGILKKSKYGRLTPIHFIEKRNGSYYWVFKCDCGVTKIINKNSVERGFTNSCGCLRKELSKNYRHNTKHGMRDSRFYKIWDHIQYRTNNPTYHLFYRYGGRGIKCLWKSFDEFKNDMFDSYKTHVELFGEENTSIDRINNDGHYCKPNCRWATRLEQARNKSRSIEKALTTPVR